MRSNRRKSMHPSYRVGDSVVVKSGVMCPDCPTLSLSGWQGRVTALYPSEGTLEIQWDSVTLQAVPEDYVKESEIEGLDWKRMGLGVQDVEPASARDRLDEVEKVSRQIEARHRWDHLADYNPGISEVLGGLEEDEIEACLNVWEQHLSQVLRFPFEAEVREQIGGGPIQVGDRVQVKGIIDIDDLYGILVNARREGRSYTLPLCDLEATDIKSSNYQPLNDYVIWYANR
jgi:hypothetical protein